jgi:Leucine-rich repeat (LRR) protein
MIYLSLLKVLRINGNRLIQVPKDLPKLTNLENLDISDNQLSQPPVGLSQLPNLKLLVIMNNPWDDSTLPVLTTLTTQLRNREVVVHVNE